MTAHQIIFYILAAAILVTGFLSVTTPKVFRSAIFLLFSLLGIAGLYFWMEVEFIAAVQISVYVGGIVVLIIFSIFLTDQGAKETRSAPPIRIISALLAAMFGIIFTYLIISKYAFVSSSQPFDFTVEKVGTAMLDTGKGGYTLPFEVISMLLLAAMVGCIVVAMKARIINPEQSSKNIEQLKDEEK